MAELSVPANDLINEFSRNVFSGSLVQSSPLLANPRLSYPSKLGRLTVMFDLSTKREVSELRVLLHPAENTDVLPPAELLSAFGIPDSVIGVSLSNTVHAINGNVLMSDGSARHYFVCSAQWTLSVGSFEHFLEPVDVALLVCICFSHLLEQAAAPKTVCSVPLRVEPALPPLREPADHAHCWPGSAVVSATPVLGSLSLPESFMLPDSAETAIEAEGWTGPRRRRICWFSAWLQSYIQVRTSEEESWSRWYSERCAALSERLSLCAVSVSVSAKLPSGQSTNVVITEPLNLEQVCARINALRCGISAEFTGGASRGCKITFPTEHLPRFIITSNGSFDCSPFPQTSQLQAELVSLVLTAATPPSTTCCPTEVIVSSDKSIL